MGRRKIKKAIWISILMILFLLVGFLAVFYVANSEAFKSCEFKTEEEALMIASREFAKTQKRRTELQGHDFKGDVELLELDVNDGHYTAVVIFSSETSKIVRRMVIRDDCLQEQTVLE